jgi:two-component system chemotaxis sensor kinase CheA
MNAPRSSFFGKYRLLLTGIAVFFVLSVGIFGLNYILSVQIASDGSRIRDSGAIRGLTQQHAKAIFSLSRENAADEMMQTSQAQISESSAALEEALARSLGAARAANVAAELELLAKFEKYWRPLAEASKLVDARPDPDAGDIAAVLNRSNANNVRLMQMADDLTQLIESAAAKRARDLSLIQTVAIVLASINFLFIVVYTLRSLRRSDDLAEQARRETEQIMATVREGLFLIDRSGAVGSQRSRFLAKAFPHALPAGTNFLDVLAPMVSTETIKSAREYVGLLFNKRVKASLLKSLNPLNRVEIVDASDGGRPAVYLSFDFSPVSGGGNEGVTALLVSAVDITQQVTLEHELEQAEERAQNEMRLLVSILENDPAVVSTFLANAMLSLGSINEELRDIKSGPGSYNMLINRIFRSVHSVKGEAAALSLETISGRAHQFEETLSGLRKRLDLRGEDLIAVATNIGQLLEELSKVRVIVERIGVFGTESSREGNGAEEDIHHTLQRIQRLTLAVAADLGKQVRVETSVSPLGPLPDSFRRLINEGLPQLVRNAVAHGIEPATERIKSGKPAEGQVRIEVRHGEAGGLELVVTDDGRGIDPIDLRHKLMTTGRFNAQDIAAMTDRQVVGTIFQPGVSTIEEAHQHAGRGVGLDLLVNLAKETGARLKLASSPATHTRFTLQWSPAT